MRFKTVTADRIFPLLGVFGSVAVSRKGVLTIGWEVTWPTAYNAEEKVYDELLSNLAAACRVLPEWTLVHRQDMYVYDTYHGPDTQGMDYLQRCFYGHMEGRRHLTHRSYIFVSLAGRHHIDKGGQYSGIFGIRGSIDVPSRSYFRTFQGKCDEFMAILSRGGYMSARLLCEADWLGDASGTGIVQQYMMLGNRTRTMSDIALAPDSVSVYGNTAQAFVIGESDCLPTEIDSVSRVEDLSGISNDVFLSYASPLGLLLDCEHVVNQFIVMPPQAETVHRLEKERNKMSSGVKSADNRLNAEEIDEFLDDAYREGLYTVRTQTHVLAWGPDERRQDITGMISAALSAMNVSATYNRYNTPVVYYAGIPSNGFEIGKENLMLMELESALTLAPCETFDRGIEGGMLHLVDRMRHIPVTIDTQRAARAAKLINNYNMFVLGGSGSGKSFFTNTYLRNCYSAGESVFVIDVGDSYEGLCHIISEESGGRDGAYLSWDRSHPFSFNPFLNIGSWLSGQGGLCTDDYGVSFFMSFLQTVWAPASGWSSHAKVILMEMVRSFVEHVARTGMKDPVFDDFYRYVDTRIAPRILYSAPESGDGVPLTAERRQALEREHGYWIGSIRITREHLAIDEFVLSMKSYASGGSYGFLLNDPHPRDLFTSRFTVFEVDRISNDDRVFYSLCILCITNAFERKMREDVSTFKNIVIDEAWKAIANETMAPYLAGLFKTSRKYQTSACVITQEMADIVSSSVIRTAIVDNSSVKVLLEQDNNAGKFGPIREFLSLTDMDCNLVLSINRRLDPAYRYREVFIKLGGRRSYVLAVEGSPQEALAFESAKEDKQPFLRKAAELGSYIAAADELTGRPHDAATVAMLEGRRGETTVERREETVDFDDFNEFDL